MARKSEYTKALNVSYTTQNLQTYGKSHAAEIKKEYMRLRKITTRREERLRRSEFQFNKPALNAKSLVRKLKPSGELSTRQMATRIAEMSQFLDMRGSTIKGAREIRRESRAYTEKAMSYYDEDGNYHAYHFRSMKEFDLFTQFMDYIRVLWKDNFYYDIENVRDYFKDYAQEVASKAMTFDQFVDTFAEKYPRDKKPLERPTKFK